MVVDDVSDMEPLFRQQFRNVVKAGAVSLRFALSGESASEYLDADSADLVLILSDINLERRSRAQSCTIVICKVNRVSYQVVSDQWPVRAVEGYKSTL